MEPNNAESQLALDLAVSEETEKAEKLGEDRVGVLRSVGSGKLDTLQERVAWILNHYPKTRDSDIALQIVYWKRFDSDIYSGGVIDPEDLYTLTRLTSLQRARAKIQNTYKLFQASPEVRQRRGKLEESEKEKAAEQRPSYDETFFVCADESGKTQNHLVVGSLWFLHAPETATVTQEIEACKRRRSFEGELHFKKISKSNLPLYKEVADILISKSSTISFKAIVVENKGIKVNDALAELYYLLLVNGVQHEHETGRGSLPRMLQLWKDAEEPGSDNLMLSNIEDRIVQAGKSRFDDKLRADHFEAVDSEKMLPIQLADLFTSSVNRVLNATGNRNGAKDSFADHLLNSIGMPSGPTEEKSTSDMTYYLGL